MKNRPTVSELLSKFKSDPAYVRQAVAEIKAEREKNWRASAADEVGLVAECVSIGYAIQSVWDFVNNDPHPVLARPFVGPYERAYPVLVKHLTLPHHPKIREGIIRSLTVRNGGSFVADALLSEFLEERDPSMRWVIANALKVAMPLKERKKHPAIATVYGRKGAP